MGRIAERGEKFRNCGLSPSKYLLFNLALIVDVSEVKLPGEAKQTNLPPECGEPIDGGAPGDSVL
jgi:hypothetical protein